MRLGEVGDPRADVHGDAREVVAGELALAGVQAGPDLDVQPARGVDQRQRAADRPGGAVE